MPQTLTVAQAVVGGVPSALAPHAEVVATAQDALQAVLVNTEAVEGIIDARVVGHGATVAVIVSHVLDGAGAAQRLAWDVIAAAADAARRLKLEAAAHGLAVDAYPGSLLGTGIAVADVTYGERPSETLVLALGGSVAVGAFNAPLLRTFADAFATPSLAAAVGYIFEVHDLLAARKTMLAAPADLHHLVRCLAEPGRYLIRSVVTAEGEVVASASAARAVDVVGTPSDDAPVAIVRAGGLHPAPDAVVAPYRLVPAVVGAGAVGGGTEPLAPLELADASDPHAPTSGGPRVHLVALQLAHGRIVSMRDLFANDELDEARALVRSIAGWASQLPGGGSPHASEPATGRWSEI